jgi:hypothetical protein
MRHAGFLLLMAVIAAPAGAQPHHNYDALENRRLDQIAQDEIDKRIAARAAAKSAPQTEAEKDAARWRADHLTCANRKGRTRAQFDAECKPAAAS